MKSTWIINNLTYLYEEVIKRFDEASSASATLIIRLEYLGYPSPELDIACDYRLPTFV